MSSTHHASKASSSIEHFIQGLKILNNRDNVHSLDIKNTFMLFVEHYERQSNESRLKIQASLQKSLPSCFKTVIYSLDQASMQTSEDKERWFAWLRSRFLINPAYDVSLVQNDIAMYQDLESLRNSIHRDISNTFQENKDKENALNTAVWCRENDIRLVCGRFSRAFYIDGMLMGSAKLLPSVSLKPAITPMTRLLSTHPKEIDAPLYLGAELQSLDNLLAKESFSLAEINGILERLKRALSSMDSKLTNKAEKQYQGQWSQLKKFLSILNSFSLRLREKISLLEEKLQQAPKKDPAFLVFFQRLTNTGAINIGLLNEKKDPFFSEDEEIHHLLRESGHHLYVTPHLQTWLRKCDDWIEALPAYASYAITPKPTGGYQISAWVQRASLEEMYRRHADDWSENIQEVMRLEEIEIARQWLCPSVTKSTEIFKYLKKNNLESVCAGIAVLIHSIAFDKSVSLSNLQASGKTRQTGLKELFLHTVENDKSLKFLAAKSDFTPLTKALNKYLDKSGLLSNLEQYLPLVFLKPRALPCAHVLTTLGPGETEVHIESWLEESMLLYNLVQHFQLGKEVQKKVKQYQQEIIQVSKGVIQQQELNGTLLGIIKEDGLDENNPDHVDKSILKLLLSFPEIAREVAKVLNLTPAQLNKRLDRTFSVLTARREVIVENNLLHEQNNPYFRFESAGSCKRYHLLYTPSRVDLGVEEVYSVQGVPKWLGGKDQAASVRGKELYSLYNANPQSVPSPRLAEFMKVGENFFTRGGVYYLSLAAGANIDALGIGDFEYFRDQWNMRGDRLVLPTGETYGGFCVPKEFTLLFSITLAAVDPVTSKQVLTSFGIPESLHTIIISDLKKLLGEKLNCNSAADWELKVQEFLLTKYPEYFKSEIDSFYLPNIYELLRIFEKSGIISTQKESLKQDQYKLVNWINKKAQGLEEINRVGPFRKIHLIRQLLDQARVLNPKVASDESILGVMTASYKEGAIKDGREIPITDVRFSASARKLEIIAGTYEKHLLKDIDPEGREVIKDILKGFNTFGDVRMVGTCTGSDLLNYVPGSGLEDVKESVNNQLLEAGLTQATIDANCKVYGAQLSKWVGIRELPEESQKQLLDKIGNQIHLLVIDRRGTSATYEEAIQGVDFIDLGIPDPGLLDLLDNLPKLIYLMRKGNPNSALVLADGTSGGRRRSFSFRYASSRRKVKELCALDSQVIYGCLGLGDETVQMWKAEVNQERQLAAELLDAIRNKNRTLAESVFDEIRRIDILEEKAEKAAVDEKKARDNGVWSIKDRYLSRFYGKLKSGMTLNELDFGSWLLLGGMYLINGKFSTDEFTSISKEFKKLQSSRKFTPFFKDNEIIQIMDGFLKPLYQPSADDEYREMKTGIGGSLKAVEEKVARLEKLNERRKMALKLMGLKQRKTAFEKEYQSLNDPSLFNTVDRIYQAILNSLPVTSRFNQEDTGKLIASLHRISEVLITDVQSSEKALRDNAAFIQNFTNDITAYLSGNELTLDDYKLLSKYYEHTAELCTLNESKESLAKAMELLDILWLCEKTLSIDSRQEMMNELARFFDVTLNNHIFDYIPYHYHTERGTGFKSYSRSELLELSTQHHQWLYRHISFLIAQETELAELPLSYRNLWMGNALDEKYPLGINLDDKTEQFWFSYARLRDLTVLRHEGIVLPQVINGLPGDLLKTSERANVVIIYPHGNTTVPVALEQGAKLSRNDQVNLMLSAFPVLSSDKQNTKLKIQDAFMFITREDFQKIQAHASFDASINPPVDDKSDRVLIMAKFTEPIEPHAIFFHFTHYLRPVIDATNLPIIQPFLWEAATHLKCRLPEMLKGSGVRTADQDNWYQKDTLTKPEKTVRQNIEKMVKTMAKTHDTLIIKSEKESGGRSAMILPVSRDGQLIDENIKTLANHIYQVSRVDNVVLQQVLKSHVRWLYTTEFLDDMVNRFIKIGIPVNLERDPKSPLFSYFRLIVIKGPSGYRITHNITVLSTQGVANVGQGGLLYEYSDACINPKYREFLRKEMELAAFNSMASQQKYLKTHGKGILTEYLEAHPEFRDQINIDEEIKHTDIPYEMGDYMPVMLVDAQDCLTHIFDRTSEKVIPLFANGKPTGVKVYDKSGKPVAPPYPMFDAEGKLIKRYNAKKEILPPLSVFKIEPNPGAGLWRPHNDQLPIERKGEGVYLLFQALGEIAKEYKLKKK